MKIDGRCHCGAIAYEAVIDESHVFICHCEDCQSFSGAPFRVRVLAPPDQFRLTSGTPRAYVKVAESGASRSMYFCGECGTQVYATDVDDASLPVSISAGTARQKSRLEPVAQVWCDSSLPWLSKLEGIQRIERQTYAGGDPRGQPGYRRKGST